MSLDLRIKQAIRDIPDYPQPGVIFKDIAPLLADPALMEEIVNAQVAHWKPMKIDAVAAIEARGFVVGSIMAYILKCPFILVRKLGKLPYKTISQEYSLEYGTAAIEMHVDAVRPGMRVLIHDDLLATGGTAAATGELIRKLGGEIAGFSFVINLSFLPGERNLKNKFMMDPFYLVEY